MHPYPCKFPPQTTEGYFADDAVVLDPFCGSGTTLVEAMRSGATAWGVDCNPIAILISQFKTMDLDPKLRRQAPRIIGQLSNLRPWTGDIRLHDFPGRDHWFEPEVQADLVQILSIIDRQEHEPTKIWLRTALSAIVNLVSNQDSETRYTRRAKGLRAGDTLRIFSRKAVNAYEALEVRGSLRGNLGGLLRESVNEGLSLADGSVDLILTSPPYANTMDYYLYHKQRMNVLGLDFKSVQAQEIGSRHEFSSKKATVDKWQNDFNACVAEMARVLRPNGRMVLVIGDSQIAGSLISAVDVVSKAAAENGLTSRVLESTPMAGRSRSFGRAFQRPNKYEHVIEVRHL